MPHVVDIDKSSNMFGENYKYYRRIVVNCPKQRNTGKGKKVMNMEKTLVKFRMNDRTIDSQELDYTLSYRADALLHARDLVGFAHVPEKDQTHTPIEVSLDFYDVPLTTLNDFRDVNQVHGLDDMTVVDYNDAMREVDYELMEAVDNNDELRQAIKDCTMGQLLLIMQEIKTNIDNRYGKN